MGRIHHLIVVGLMFLILGLSVAAVSNAGAATTSHLTIQAAQETPPSQDGSAPPPSETPTSSEVDLLRQRFDDFESFIDLILVPLSIFLVFVAAGGVFSLIFSIRNEVRTSQTHALLVAGETAQQARTEALHSTLFDASEKTITLVNQTLALARDSTERATKALSERASQLVGDVGQEMSALIARVMMHERFEEKFFKAMVEEPSNRRKLKQLADRLSTVEGYLAFQDIELEPAARLVKGMALHLDQDDQGAIEHLGHAAEGLGVSLRVRLCAYYFIGYAHNNIGEYRSAAAAFDAGSGRASAKDPLQVEFARMASESRFFDLVRLHCSGQDVFQPVEQEVGVLMKLRTEAALGAKANVEQSLGNIHLFLAREAGRVSAYSDALASFVAAGSGLWARFGQLEVINEAGTEVSVPKGAPSAEEVESLASKRIQTRGEPRSIVLLHLATGMCRAWRGAGDDTIRAALSGVDDQLGKVDSDLRLYSLRLRSNVTREQFLERDVQWLSRSISKDTNGNEA